MKFPGALPTELHPVPAAADAGYLSLAPAPAGAGRRAWAAGRNLGRLALPLLVLAGWQALSAAGILKPRVLDSPVAVLDALLEMMDSGILQESLVASGRRAAQGFALGGGTGLLLGVVAGLSRIGEQSYDALLQMLRMVPFLALIPLFVVWFGVGEQPKVLLIAIACVFPIYISTFAGARNVDPKIVEAAGVFGMGRWAIAFGIVLPLALPTILVGVRYAMGTALLALVGAEQVNATSGIGYLALNPRAALRTDIILAVVLVYSVLGLGVDLFIRVLQRLLLPWHRTLLEKA